jgi:hypothetical protein
MQEGAGVRQVVEEDLRRVGLRVRQLESRALRELQAAAPELRFYLRAE